MFKKVKLCIDNINNNLKVVNRLSTFSEDEKIQLLADIVEMDTVNDNEIEVCEYLKDLLEKHDIESEILEIEGKRANLVAEIGSGSPVLAISGHMDVVDIGEKDEWSHDPFELTEEDGKLYGRGTTDMKGGLMAMVIALIELKEEDKLPNGTIRLLATTNEEKEQHGAGYFAEKGYLDDVDGLIIGEPTDNALFYAHKGSMGCRVVAKGKAAHSSMPFLGENAIELLIEFMEKLKAEYKEIKKNDNEHELNIAPMIDKFAGDSISKEEKDFASGLTMIGSIIQGGKQFNSVPEVASIEYNVRTVPEYDNDFIKELFEKVIKEVDEDHLKLEIASSLDPVVSDEDNELIKAINETAANYVDKDEIVVSALIGTTDASSFLGDNENNVDLAVFGPGKSLVAHQIDEYIEKDMYLNYIDIYKDAFVKYLEEKEG